MTEPPDQPRGRARVAGRAVADAARRIDRSEPLLRAVRRLRDHLPGDRHFGDPLSTADRKHFAVLQRQLQDITGSEEGVVRELSGGALQVWQAFLSARGRDVGEIEVTLLFTDLVGFSSWALTAGDDRTLQLLRQVGHAVEPPVVACGGQVVKRLGDGMMAAFREPQAAFDAVVEARSRLAAIELPGDSWRPRMRAGIHTGRPRRLGGDLLGVDVNIAARLVERAGTGEILASGAAIAGLSPERAAWRRKKTFALLRVKGVPDELDVYAVTPKP
jgi:adenylate cyclase